MVLSTNPDVIESKKLAKKIRKTIQQKKVTVVLTSLTEVIIEIAITMSKVDEITVTQEIERINKIILDGSRVMEKRFNYKSDYGNHKGGDEDDVNV